ncbi:MAG: class I tRNA ligase family protein [Ruminococcus sp.]|nr:class I tRNA ligase family protein [Ruminococcus sp.]
MPYGNKKLHFGHIGGVFIFADVYARFLQDRIGSDNVIFVSGTDCYGSPIVESYRKLVEGGYTGSITDFVMENNASQKRTLAAFSVAPSIFEGSAIGRAGEIHAEYSLEFIRKMHEHGKLEKLSTKQFFDEKAGVFLNGRQVIGRCPVVGCSSEKAYADECDLGHSFLPKDLINPVSTLTGETPVMREVSNWYYKLPDDMAVLREYVDGSRGKARAVVTKTVSEFLEPPVIFVMNDYREGYEAVRDNLPPHEEVVDPKKTSFTIKFTKLSDREAAEETLAAKNIRFRTGKTLVPFRLTGNTEWGLPAPVLEAAEEPSTIYVWPESLWAPISFTKAYLESIGENDEKWKDFWCSPESKVYQFIGQDNIYFYSVAEPGMFMAYNSPDAHLPNPGELQIPEFAANHHILFLDKKASSSGQIKPPLADELLDFYTVDQLRMHFISLGLAMRSVSFLPKPFNPSAKETDSDPVTKEGFLLNNVLNRICRTALYEVQKCCDGVYPVGEVSPEVTLEAEQAILQYERFMHRLEFHQVSYVLDSFIRFLSKVQSKGKTVSDKADGAEIRRQWLIDTLYGIRVSLSLLHPIVPDSCELVRGYFKLPRSIYNWDNIFDSLSDSFGGVSEFTPGFIEPRFDFFKKHPSQL